MFVKDLLVGEKSGLKYGTKLNIVPMPVKKKEGKLGAPKSHLFYHWKNQEKNISQIC